MRGRGEQRGDEARVEREEREEERDVRGGEAERAAVEVEGLERGEGVGRGAGGRVAEARPRGEYGGGGRRRRGRRGRREGRRLEVVGEGRRGGGGGGARSRRSRSWQRRRHGKWARSVAGVEREAVQRVQTSEEWTLLAEDNVQKLPRNFNEFGACLMH